MKKLLCATALSCILSLSAAGASAHAAKATDEKEAKIIKASYSLPKKDGEEFRQTMHEADEENLDLKQRVALAHADMYDILTAEDFDRKAFVAKAAEARNSQDQMHENRDEAFAAAAVQLTPDERETLASALENSSPHQDSGHHHKSIGGSGNTSSNDNGTVTQ